MRKSGVFTTVRTNGMEFFNPGGTAPAVDSVLVVKERGVVRPTQNLAVNSVTTQQIDLSGGVLTYTDTSGLLVNGAPVGSGGGGSFPPSNIRYFIFYNQNVVADSPDALLTWPEGQWTDVSGRISTADWTCSVVGFDYNYTGAALNLSAPQYTATCFPDGPVWYLRRRMPDAFGSNAFMGFHIMAMRNTICDDRRFTIPEPFALVTEASGADIAVRWGDISSSYPEIESMVIDWREVAARSFAGATVPIEELMYKIESLRPATNYTVTARYQRHDGGLGAASTRTVSTNPTPPLPTPAVEVLQGSITSRSFAVQLTEIPPSAATAVRFTLSPSGILDVSTNSSPWVIDDLDQATTYVVSVQYVYATGLSSAAIIAATTEEIPAPAEVDLTAFVDSVDVAWSAAPPWVTEAIVHVSGKGTTTVPISPAAYTVHDLLPDTEYTIEVAYSDGRQQGEYYGHTISTRGLPAAPDANLDTPTSRSFQVLWRNVPAEATDIRIWWSQGNGDITLNTSQTPHVIDDLSQNTYYDVSAQYLSASGPGAITSMRIPTTLIGAPTGVRITSVTATTITVAWNTDYLPFWITGTILDWGTGSMTVTTPENTYAITDLDPSTTYTIDVVLTDGLQIGGAESVTATTLNILPGKPTDLGVDGYPYPNVVMMWIPSGNTDYYKIYLDGNFFRTQIADSGVVKQYSILSNLVPHQQYTMTVVGYTNADVSGQMSDPYSFTAFPMFVPTAYYDISWNSIYPLNLTLTWVPPPAYVNHIYVYWRKTDTETLWTQSTDRVGTTTFTTPDLLPGVMYSFYVAFMKDTFSGPTIETSYVVPPVPPPVASIISTTSSSVTVSWAAPPNGYAITDTMHIQCDTVGGNIVFEGDFSRSGNATYTVQDLQSSTSYSILLMWVTPSGYSDPGMVEFTTQPPAPPQPPPSFGFMDRSWDGSSKLTLDIASSGSDPVLAGYMVPDGSPLIGYTFNQIRFPQTIQSINNVYSYGLVSCTVYLDSSQSPSKELGTSQQASVTTTDDSTIYQDITLTMNTTITLAAGNYIVFYSEGADSTSWDGYFSDVTFKAVSFSVTDTLLPLIGGNTKVGPLSAISNVSPSYGTLYEWPTGLGAQCAFGLAPTALSATYNTGSNNIVVTWNQWRTHAQPTDSIILHWSTSAGSQSQPITIDATTTNYAFSMNYPDTTYTITMIFKTGSIQGPTTTTTLVVPAVDSWSTVSGPPLYYYNQVTGQTSYQFPN